jgi:hypothetical protein
MLAKPFPVRIDGDTDREWNEGFGVTILEAKNATLPAQETSGMILDDDRPRLSISDAQVVEGNAGTRNMVFTVSLSDVETRDVSFHATTFNANATGGSDYTPVDLNLQTIPMGQLSRTVTVPILGDTSVEASEVFYVRLTSSSGAPAFDRQGSGLIINDDGPTLSIGDLSTTEGNSGTKTLTFTISLSQASASPVFYNLATGNGSATAGSDYVAAAATGQMIPAGMLSKTFAVTINGDSTTEGNEQFVVTLTGSSGATIADAGAVGTITNDD